LSPCVVSDNFSHLAVDVVPSLIADDIPHLIYDDTPFIADFPYLVLLIYMGINDITHLDAS
jgi:hypothetical protein